MKNARTHTQGFTLIELMVTLAVAAITASVAIPSIEELIHNNRTSSQINELVTALNIARSEAAKRQVPVIVCSSTNQASCNTDSWENGWIIFADNNSNSAIDGGGVDEILQVQDAQKGDNTLRSSFADAGQVEYTAEGNIDPIVGGTFVLCNHWGAARAKAININSTGRVRLATDSPDVGGTVEDIAGNDVTCP